MYDRGIEAFLAVASCRSIAGAARLLHLTPSVISHRYPRIGARQGIDILEKIAKKKGYLKNAHQKNQVMKRSGENIA